MAIFDAIMLLVEFFFFLDIIVNFISVYEKYDGSYEYSLKKIAKKYLAGLFWIDLLAIMPTNMLMSIFTDSDHGQKSHSADMIKLVRLVKVFTIKSYIMKMISQLKVNRDYLRIILLLSVSILFIH